MPDDLTEQISTNAQQPASASNDSGSVTQHNLRDLIAADKYLKNQTAISGTQRGLVFSKIVPPGASS